ncbi:BIR protein, partial [Plasmodium berghei]
MILNVCETFKGIEELLNDDFYLHGINDNTKLLEIYCPISSETGKRECKTASQRVNAATVLLFNHLFSGDENIESDNKNNEYIMYIMLWLSSKMNLITDGTYGSVSDFYTTFIKNGDVDVDVDDNYYYDYFDKISEKKEIMKIKIEGMHELYELLKDLCNAINNSSEDSSNCSDCSNFANKWKDQSNKLVEKETKVYEDEYYCDVLLTLKKAYEKFKKDNGIQNKLPELEKIEKINNCKELCKDANNSWRIIDASSQDLSNEIDRNFSDILKTIPSKDKKKYRILKKFVKIIKKITIKKRRIVKKKKRKKVIVKAPMNKKQSNKHQGSSQGGKQSVTEEPSQISEDESYSEDESDLEGEEEDSEQTEPKNNYQNTEQQNTVDQASNQSDNPSYSEGASSASGNELENSGKSQEDSEEQTNTNLSTKTNNQTVVQEQSGAEPETDSKPEPELEPQLKSQTESPLPPPPQAQQHQPSLSQPEQEQEQTQIKSQKELAPQQEPSTPSSSETKKQEQLESPSTQEKSLTKHETGFLYGLYKTHISSFYKNLTDYGHRLYESVSTSLTKGYSAFNKISNDLINHLNKVNDTLPSVDNNIHQKDSGSDLLPSDSPSETPLSSPIQSSDNKVEGENQEKEPEDKSHEKETESGSQEINGGSGDTISEPEGGSEDTISEPEGGSEDTISEPEVGNQENKTEGKDQISETGSKDEVPIPTPAPEEPSKDSINKIHDQGIKQLPPEIKVEKGIFEIGFPGDVFKGYKLFVYLVIIIGIPIILALMYKYFSFGWRKELKKKKNMKKVINMFGGNEKTKRVINPTDRKKQVQIIINLSKKKQDKKLTNPSTQKKQDEKVTSSSTQKKQTKQFINSIYWGKYPLLN